MTKKWFIIRLILISAIGSSVICFIIIPAIGIIRNLVLYNWLSLGIVGEEMLTALIYGWIPFFQVLLPLTALGLYLYVKLKKRYNHNINIPE